MENFVWPGMSIKICSSQYNCGQYGLFTTKEVPINAINQRTRLCVKAYIGKNHSGALVQSVGILFPVMTKYGTRITSQISGATLKKTDCKSFLRLVCFFDDIATPHNPWAKMFMI